MKRVAVSLLPQPNQLAAETELAIVIDVLRATTVMTVALANGAQSIITFQQIEEARAAARCDPSVLLCGERNCRPIDGFTFGNSPTEYDRTAVSNRILALTTTNGTRAIAACNHVPRVLAASFLNSAAVIATATQAKLLHIVCAGTDRQITAEDVLLAGLLVEILQSQHGFACQGDEALIAAQFYRSWFNTMRPDRELLTAKLRQTQGGRNLIRVGYDADLEHCAAVDSIAIVPQRVNTSPPTFVAVE